MTQSALSPYSSGSSEEETHDLAEMEGSIVKSSTCLYHIQKLLDRGTSSHVFKCQNLGTSKDVALKVHKNYALFENEIDMQEIVSVLDPEKKSIVEFIETFTFNEHPCLVFELLDTSLFSMVYDKRWKTFSPNDIRPVAQQLLTAFDALKSIGVIHTDLKSDNIMLVDHAMQPFRVKLIDFGLSITTSEAPLSYGVALQPMGNRAPEVALGLPFSEAIDMWSLGCVLSFLYLGNYLFLANSNYNMLRSMIEVVGRIPDHLLSASKNTHKYFKKNTRDNDGDHPKWRLMTEKEYQDKTGVRPESLLWSFKCLEDLMKLRPHVNEPIEMEDRKAFVDLLKCLLQMDPEQRITPEEALKHPFLTMSHLSEHKNTSPYVIDSYDKMKFCPVNDFRKDHGDPQPEPDPVVSPKNWRKKFCPFFRTRKTDEPVLAGSAQYVELKTWWQKLCQFFRTKSRPDPLALDANSSPGLSSRGPAPRLQSKKTWRKKIFHFFRMNQIGPEPDHRPGHQSGSPIKVHAKPDGDHKCAGPNESSQVNSQSSCIKKDEPQRDKDNDSAAVNNKAKVDLKTTRVAGKRRRDMTFDLNYLNYRRKNANQKTKKSDA
ncbi:homeodomain-interacting protein kinase 2-like isoform X2 [Dunckerocampus dactyliophorus]|uniref:homeodomain-interacting protein kinase 2-like isoform X2 n=1 Tax=Dunckerocampus dactyliophorus TaxID=161453 RepID=UPI002405BD8E|nr:homeodomain-interacting protein kinase 2-like isoform X2 [Dunckerocampus dactyliophorus]